MQNYVKLKYKIQGKLYYSIFDHLYNFQPRILREDDLYKKNENNSIWKNEIHLHELENWSNLKFKIYYITNFILSL